MLTTSECSKLLELLTESLEALKGKQCFHPEVVLALGFAVGYLEAAIRGTEKHREVGEWKQG